MFMQMIWEAKISTISTPQSKDKDVVLVFSHSQN